MREDGRRIEVGGTVQGVGFRPWVYRVASQCGVAGRVSNAADGVTIEVFGNTEQLEQFVHDLGHDAPPASRIETLTTRPLPFVDLPTFTIAPSVEGATRRVSIPPDLTTCPDCLGEMLNRKNRRHRYPFTNCTNCGPRYSIVRDVPYDRANTTMDRFALCPDCAREYRSPADRRFHAEPNACPACGPRLSALSFDGAALRVSDPLAFAVRTLNSQMIVAMKGIGGFHLVCDATSESAVNRLRQRKRRPAKPFAVMVGDLDAAAELAQLSEGERALLISAERPVVLVRRRIDCMLASGVAPGNDLIGLMLPCSPLHHLLLRDIGKPLVMTSGNRSDEPMAHRLVDALRSLGGIADVFLTHNREIESRVDDSVARVIAGKPVLFRRSRGYVPRTIALLRPVDRPILACGAHLENAFCLASGNRAFVGPHIGDLDGIETTRDYETSIERAKVLLRWAPAVIAHDLHPDYYSTRYALSQIGVTRIGVQHHHAHVASVMAEHHLEGQVLGVAWDGNGYGTDGTAWGGEFLLTTAARFSRLATFRPLRLAGGDLAVREVWRIGLAALVDAFEDGDTAAQDMPVFRDIPPATRALVRQMLTAGVNTPAAHGVGRWFDAFSALFLGRAESRYEGEAALAWSNVADPEERGHYPFHIDQSTSPWQIDPRLMVREAVCDSQNGLPPATISGRFHNTLARIVGAVVEAHGDHGLPVVLAGCCFQSSLLTEKIIDLLGPEREVYFNQQVPAGDGGIALGQALVADAIVRERTAAAEKSDNNTSLTATGRT
jgi:hydrogenase maturation protein HypF